MMMRWLLGLLPGTAVLISACSGVSTLPLQQPDLFEQLSEIRLWSATRVETELPILENTWTRSPVADNGLILAVALGFGQCVSCDSSRALAILEDIAADAADNTAMRLASLYQELLVARAKIVTTQTQLSKQQQQIKQLQDKLNALTSIEESLHERE